MTKLSDTQTIILAAAAQRPDGNILPLPGSLRGGAAGKVVTALLTRGLIREVVSDCQSASNLDPRSASNFDSAVVAAAVGMWATRSVVQAAPEVHLASIRRRRSAKPGRDRAGFTPNARPLNRGSAENGWLFPSLGARAAC